MKEKSIEQIADTIRAEATDPEVRRLALLLKIDAIPVVYRAAYQPDPLAAFLDLWLLTYQMEDCLEVEATLNDVHRTAGGVGHLSESLEGIEETLGPDGVAAIIAPLGALIREERKAVLADVERQRNLTLEFASNERRIVLEAVNAEREAALAQFHQERVGTLAELDQLGQRYLDHTTARAFRIVDHLIWRLAQLVGGLMLLAALLAWLVLRTGRVETAASVGKSPGEMS